MPDSSRRPVDPLRDRKLTKPERPITALIFLIALVFRITWCCVQPTSGQAINRLPDQREYLELGRNLVRNHALNFYDPRFNQTVYAYRTPGYPFFIALLDASPLAIRLAQALIDTSTILAIYLLTRRLTSHRFAPLIAAGILSVNPFSIYFCGLILSETLFTALLAWGVLFLIQRRLVASGLIFLLAILVRPSALFLVPCLVVLAELLNRAPAPSYRWGRIFLAVVIVWGIVWAGLFAWALRNQRVLGEWIWTTTNSGITLYDGFNPAATGASDQRFVSEMPQLQSINEVKRSRYLAALARQWASANSGRLPGLTLKKILAHLEPRAFEPRVWPVGISIAQRRLCGAVRFAGPARCALAVVEPASEIIAGGTGDLFHAGACDVRWIAAVSGADRTAFGNSRGLWVCGGERKCSCSPLK